MTDQRDFRPLEPRRLVPMAPHETVPGAGAVFPVGTLLDEDEHTPPDGPKVLQLAARRR